MQSQTLSPKLYSTGAPILSAPVLQRAANKPSPYSKVPAIVHDVLRTPGQPLDAATRAYMEPRFGHDFSNIRVHADQTAGQSARSVNALAYTVGNDIVFKTGEYKPLTAQGKHLLAHELTHTIQQQTFASAEPASLSVKTDQRLEAQAERAAGLGAENSAGEISTHSTPAIQRQPDGVTVRSPVLEETVTQAADLAGANSGRSLTRPERELVTPVFGNSIAYDRVHLVTSDALEYRTVANNIFVPRNFTVSDAYMAETLVHEMTHVWQYQHQGTSYISNSLSAQIAAQIRRGNRNFAYDYQINPGQTFFSFGPEQQAFIVQNYYDMLRDQGQISSSAPAGASRIASLTPAVQQAAYMSIHFGANGFKMPLSAAERQAEISRELPLHEALIQQMQQALPRTELDLMNQRAMDVMRSPGDNILQTPPERQIAPVRPLIELRF